MGKVISFLAGALMMLLLGWLVRPVVARPDLPAPQIRFTPMPPTSQPTQQPDPAATMVPVMNPITPAGQLGLTSQVKCFNCVPQQVRVKLSHYDPQAGPDNCWDYDENMNHCYSPTQPGIRWQGVWGVGVACPPAWPFGTWVTVEDVGSFICLDRGGRIQCDDTGLCRVDVMTGTTSWWDQQEFTATLWLPTDPERVNED